MSQPAPFNRSFSFTNFQAANPSLPIPGGQLDLELNNAKSTFDGVLTNLKQIQRDDGALKNGSVTFDTLSPSLQTAGIAPALPWVTSTGYAVSASVTHGSAFYRCLIAHTAGVFATDLAAGNWVLIVDFSTIALVAAAMIAVTPSGSLTTDVQGSLQALDTGKAPLSHTQLSSTISDSTAAGRALLTAADANAQNVLLGTTTLGFQCGNIKETAGLVLETGWYWCDGSNKNRVTDASLFNAITIQQNGVTTSGSPVITGLSDTTNGGNTPMSPGMPLSGPGIPALAVVLSVDSATQVTMSLPATGSATTPLVFAPYGVGDGSSTFGIANRAYLAVGRDNASGTASNVTQVSTTATLVTGNSNITVASAAGLAIGMFVSHPKLPIGTKINTMSGTAIGCSNVATGSVSGSTVRFSPLLDAQTPGATGGALNRSLVTANLPPYTPTGSVSNGAITTGFGSTVYVGTSSASSAVGSGGAVVPTGATTIGLSSSQGASSFAGAPQGGTSTAFGNVPPTIVVNYIIKR